MVVTNFFRITIAFQVNADDSQILWEKFKHFLPREGKGREAMNK
jgi:hypothetical protein